MRDFLTQTRTRLLPGLLPGLLLVALAATAVTTPTAQAQWGSSEARVRCDSPGGRDRFCAAPNDGRVRLVRMLGGSPCVEGQSWRHDRQGIYVRGGCAAEFVLMQTGGGGNEGWGNSEFDVQCDSDDGRDRFCAADNRGMRLKRTLSRAPCVEGQSWRADRRGVYVRSGCRGVFTASSTGGGGGNGWGNSGNNGWGNGSNGGSGGWGNGGNNGGSWGGEPISIRCQSIGGRWGACPVDIRGKVRLVRKESRADCVRGWSWGTLGRDAIWVSEGCRAVFEVQGRPSSSGRADYGGDGVAPPGIRRERLAGDTTADY
jgi:hypothetical protein